MPLIGQYLVLFVSIKAALTETQALLFPNPTPYSIITHTQSRKVHAHTHTHTQAQTVL